MKAHLILIVLLILIVISCSTNETGKADANQLHDIWALESINGESFVMDEQTRNHPTIEIYVEEERVLGNTGCNNFNGKLKVDKNQISFSQIISTEMACPGDLENRFLLAIESIDNYKIEKLSLFLFQDEEEKLVFRKVD